MLRRTVVDGELHQIHQAYLPVKGNLDGVHFPKWKIQVSGAVDGWVPAGTNPSGIRQGQTGQRIVPSPPAPTRSTCSATACLVMARPGSSTEAPATACPPALSLEALLHLGAKLIADLGRVIDDRAAAAMARILNRCHGIPNRIEIPCTSPMRRRAATARFELSGSISSRTRIRLQISEARIRVTPGSWEPTRHFHRHDSGLIQMAALDRIGCRAVGLGHAGDD